MAFYLQSTLGLIFFLLLAYFLSENKKQIDYIKSSKTLAFMILLSFATKTNFLTKFFYYANIFMSKINASSKEATSFVFGYLATGESPYVLIGKANPFILALQSFPAVILVSTVLSILFYLNIMSFIINNTVKIFKLLLDTSSALGTGIVANIFVGLSQSPLTIKPYLNNLTRSEIFSFICCGMAGSASAIVIIYANTLEQYIKQPLDHLLTAVLMNIFSALLLARIIIPEHSQSKEKVKDNTHHTQAIENKHASFMDAVYSGIMDGSRIIVNVIAIIIGFLGLVHLCNNILIDILPQQINSIEKILGIMFYPISFMIGISPEACQEAGAILAKKLILNELIAYFDLIKSNIKNTKDLLIMLYALCGFANLSSMAVTLASYTVLTPNRKEEISQLLYKALLVSTLANCLTANIISFTI